MQNKILIEGDDKGANYSIMCNGEFLTHAIIQLFESVTRIDSDGHIAMLILKRITDIAENKYLKK